MEFLALLHGMGEFPKVSLNVVRSPSLIEGRMILERSSCGTQFLSRLKLDSDTGDSRFLISRR